jgi:hypothetical protein
VANLFKVGRQDKLIVASDKIIDYGVRVVARGFVDSFTSPDVNEIPARPAACLLLDAHVDVDVKVKVAKDVTKGARRILDDRFCFIPIGFL